MDDFARVVRVVNNVYEPGHVHPPLHRDDRACVGKSTALCSIRDLIWCMFVLDETCKWVCPRDNVICFNLLFLFF